MQKFRNFASKQSRKLLYFSSNLEAILNALYFGIGFKISKKVKFFPYFG